MLAASSTKLVAGKEGLRKDLDTSQLGAGGGIECHQNGRGFSALEREGGWGDRDGC